MSKQRRTADDFVRDMKAKQQQHSTPGDIERKTSERQSESCSADPGRLTLEQAGAWRGSLQLSGAISATPSSTTRCAKPCRG
jgi:hypothetical protein